MRRLCSGLSVREGLQRPVGLPSGLKTCREDLSVNAREQDVAIPFFTHNSKTIFVVAIDIFDCPEPASKRGDLKTYELLETDLIRTIGEATPVAPPQVGEATAGE